MRSTGAACDGRQRKPAGHGAEAQHASSSSTEPTGSAEPEPEVIVPEPQTFGADDQLVAPEEENAWSESVVGFVREGLQ